MTEFIARCKGIRVSKDNRALLPKQAKRKTTSYYDSRKGLIDTETFKKPKKKVIEHSEKINFRRLNLR